VIVVISGPGGVGKGTIVRALAAVDPELVVSRSWTTRARRPGEDQDAYVFADRAAFERRMHDGGFLEWTEFLGNYYGTPTPSIDDDRVLILEIEVDGAQQVRVRHPDALLIFVLPPTRAEQQRRLRARGDPEDKVAARLRKADDEEPVGLAIADHRLINDDLDHTVAELRAIIHRELADRLARTHDVDAASRPSRP
jgi:guanylate kinase